MRKYIAAAAITAALLVAGPLVAVAADETNEPAASPAETYNPQQPSQPTLAGTVFSECDSNVPWIYYSVSLVDPENKVTSNTARLVLSDGTNSHVIQLGGLDENDQLSGRVLWPGADSDGDGVADGWPGWVLVNGQWVETDDNFRWTRNDIQAHVEVNPELAVALSYPTATAECATDPAGYGGQRLPATGLSSAVLPIGLGGGAVVLIGLAIIVAQRRRSRA
ncbi:MAG: LPXTG cell wall anchor domain-containing protein [Microbacterium sp.]